MKKKSILILLFLSLFVGLLIPYPTTSIPEWKVLVVDEGGKFASYTEVIQEWSNGSIVGKSSEKRISDENGIVTFPARNFICPLFLRGIIRVVDNINYFVMPHGARVGPWASVWSNGGSPDRLFYQDGKEFKGVLIR
jgi:hypothetical protein